MVTLDDDVAMNFFYGPWKKTTQLLSRDTFENHIERAGIAKEDNFRSP